MTEDRGSASSPVAALLQRVVGELAWLALLYRWELAPAAALLAILVGVRLEVGTGLLGDLAGLILGAGAAAALARRLCTADRRRLHRAYRRMKRLRRRWPDLMADLGLCGSHNGKTVVPAIRGTELHPGGVGLSLSLPAGVTASHFERRAEALAGALQASQAIVERDRRRADRVHVTLVDEHDPLLADSPAPEPVRALRAGRDEEWGCPVGTLSDGSTANLRLLERSLLIAGSPGSGKSAALQQVCAAMALTEHTELWLIDPKRVELAVWEPCAARVCHEAVPEATALLADLIAEMDRRYDLLRARGLRKVGTPSRELPLIVLVIEELAAFTFGADKKASTEFIRALTALIQRGRAAAISVIAVTQKPQADVVPSFIRDQLAYRMAFRCGSSAHSDVILGEGMAAAGADASLIPEDTPGLGLLIGEGDRIARRFRTFHLADADLQELSARAHAYRTAKGLPAR